MSTSAPPNARLMLILPLDREPGPDLAAACLAAGDVAAVVLTGGAGDKEAARRIGALAPALQAREVAVLVADRFDLVARAGLDGAHLTGPEALAGALAALKPAAIVGAGGLLSRHDAMVAGESGADYVQFGALDPADGAFDRVRDLVAWWSALFEVPCVAVASTLDEVGALAAAGADFIALAAAMTAGAAGPANVAAAQARIAATPVATDQAS